MGRLATRVALVAAFVAAAACGSSSGGTGPVPTVDAAPDATPSGCRPGELQASDGHCEPAGIPPDRCGKGFEPDGNRGCVADLPGAACPSGTMAVPGETMCREVAPCGAGAWGDIPVESNTQFVDASFTGTSDGSMKAPWRTIQQGIDAAASGAIVALAAGSYAENVTFRGALGSGKPVRLWGKCPSM